MSARSAAVLAVLVVATSLTASATASAPPSTSSTTTTTPVALTTTAAAATTVPAATSVFPTPEDFVVAWNQTAADLLLIDPSAEVFILDPTLIVRGPVPPDTTLGNVEVFAVPIVTSGFVGGLIDPATGAVTAVTVGGDPDAPVVRGAAGTLLLATLDVSLAAPAVEAWAAMAADTSTVQANYIVAGPLGVMLQVIEGAEAGDNLVSIVIAPTTTEEDAFVASYLTYVAVFSLAISAPPPQILATPSSTVSSPTTTAPIAALPATVAPAAPTTTLLPAVSLVPTSVTAVGPTTTTTTPGPPPTTAAPVAGALT